VDKPSQNVGIDLTEPVSLTFSLKYLVNFCKASGLSDTVKLCLSNEVPLLVEYGLAGNSHLRFYLAPKVCKSHMVGTIVLTVCRLATMSNEPACDRIMFYEPMTNLEIWGDQRSLHEIDEACNGEQSAEKVELVET